MGDGSWTDHEVRVEITIKSVRESLARIAHEVDATFGDVTIRALG